MPFINDSGKFHWKFLKTGPWKFRKFYGICIIFFIEWL